MQEVVVTVRRYVRAHHLLVLAVWAVWGTVVHMELSAQSVYMDLHNGRTSPIVAPTGANPFTPAPGFRQLPAPSCTSPSCTEAPDEYRVLTCRGRRARWWQPRPKLLWLVRRTPGPDGSVTYLAATDDISCVHRWRASALGGDVAVAKLRAGVVERVTTGVLAHLGEAGESDVVGDPFDVDTSLYVESLISIGGVGHIVAYSRVVAAGFHTTTGTERAEWTSMV